MNDPAQLQSNHAAGRFRSAIPQTLLLAILLGSAVGCGRPNDDSRIRITGSDTMVNLAQAWAEKYRESHSDVATAIRGGGSGVGIAELCSGSVQMATSSRAMKPKEIELAKKNTGQTPKEFIVGRDALAIFVHRENPLQTISLAELKEIYGEEGKFTHWKQLGVENTQCRDDEIIRVIRQNSSGTYAYFREAVLGKGEYKQGATAQNGSADVVALISNTPCAIGYSGMAYRSEKVKLLPVSKKPGEAPIEPTLETALDGTYPISRPLYLYTLGEPTGTVLEFLNWVLSPAGQTIVEEIGYVPIGPTTAEKAAADKAAAEKPATAEQPATEEKKPAEEKPAATEPAPTDQPAADKPAEVQPAPAQPAEAQPAAAPSAGN